MGNAVFPYTALRGLPAYSVLGNFSDIPGATGTTTFESLRSMLAAAPLVDGKVPAENLPSYVDDVVEYESVGSLPEVGEAGLIYVTTIDNFTYRWTGSTYVRIGNTTPVWGTITGNIEDQSDLTSYISSTIGLALAEVDLSGLVPYTGAAGPVDLGANSLTCGAICATGDLLFTDATYDIGKSGVTRPRDGFFSRDLTIGRSLALAGTGYAYYNPAITLSGGGGISVQSTLPFYFSNTEYCQIYNGQFRTITGFGIGATASTPDVLLARDSAGVLHLRDATSAQTLRIAETWTSPTSFGAFQIKANTGTAYQIGSARGSAGGSNRGLSFGHFDSAGTFVEAFAVGTDGTFGSSLFKTLYINNIHSPYTDQAVTITTGATGTGGNSGTSVVVGTAFVGSRQFRIKYDTTQVFGLSVGQGNVTISPRDATSGSPTMFTLTGPAHTTLATAEVMDGYFNATRTVNFGATGGTIANQRTWVFTAPTFTAAAATTLTTAATVSISGPPVASTGVTATNAYALRIESGKSYFADHLWLSSGKYVGHGTGCGFGVSNVGAMLLPTVYYYGSAGFEFGSGIFQATAALGIGPTLSGYAATGADTLLYRDAAGIFAQRNGTNAQTYRLYETWTSSTSFGALQLQANTGAAFRIGSARGSAGGSTRAVEIGSWDSAGTFTGRFLVSDTGVTSTVSSGRVNIGINGATNQAYFTSNGSFTGLAFNRVGVYSNGIRCDNGYSVSICGHNNDEANLWGASFTVQTLTNGADLSGKITTSHGAATNVAPAEITDGFFNAARTVAFSAAGGTITNQRTWRFTAPTFTAAAATNITNLSTVAISGAPTASTNVTVNNSSGLPYALLVEQGTSEFRGTVRASGLNIGIGDGSDLYFRTPALQIADLAWAGTAYWAFMRTTTPGFVAYDVLGNGNYIGFAGNVASSDGVADVRLYRDAPNILAQRRGANAQAFRLYSTFTSSTSFEALQSYAAPGASFEIGPIQGSAGGTLRGLILGGYASGGGSGITPWLSFANTGDATFSGTVNGSGNVLDVRSGSTAQKVRIFATRSAVDNYEALALAPTTSGVTMGLEVGSAGGVTTRNINLGHWDAAGTYKHRLSMSASLYAFYSDTSLTMRLYAHGANATGPRIEGYKARGTDRNDNAYPVASDNLFGVFAYGYDESLVNWSGAKGQYVIAAAADWSSTSQGTIHSWSTTDKDDTGMTNTTRMRLFSNGNLVLGSTVQTEGLIQLVKNNNGLTGFGTSLNRFRFVDNDTATAAGQPIGEIEFYSADSGGAGAGVKGAFMCAANAANPDAYFAWGLDKTTGAVSEVMRLTSDAYLGLGDIVPTAPLDVAGNGLRVRTSRTPASAAAAGNVGDICWDSGFVYVCVATNTWKRATIATW